ncbi:hypothetical protein RB653_006678 [Dictyostelium firmibasis]|uniref:Pre-rRNA-processing protein TSR2 homolog n=1 Tax=Dictyostelium firmibasis TaxID=79012 RepID=A0AAN7TUI2_9MYCE
MNYSNIVQQHLEQQIQQQQTQQQNEQILREQLIRQQVEEQMKRGQQNQESTEVDNRPEDEYWQIFDQAVLRIFKEWTALQLAITNEWGGRTTSERAEDMRQDVLDLFLMGKQVYPDQIEKILDECLSQDLNTVAEDDSCKQVANLVIQCYNLAIKGAYNDMVSLLGPETASVISSCVKGAGNDSDDEIDGGESEMGDDDDEMMDDGDDMNDDNTNKPKKYSEPDEDGWVTVNSKRR